MREKPGVLCHLVRNYNRATRNNRARPRPRVIYPSHPESDRANGLRIGMTTTRGPRAPGPGLRTSFLFLSHSLCFSLSLAFAGQPRLKDNARPISSNSRCGTAGWSRISAMPSAEAPIGSSCRAARDYLRSIISGIYRCRHQPRAVLRPTWANDIP